MAFSISYLQSSGFYEFMLPFMLVTAVTYGVLDFVRMKNKDSFPIRGTPLVILSVVVGLFATSNREVRNLMFDWAPMVIVAIVIIFIYLIIKKLFEKETEDFLPTMVILVLLIVAIDQYGLSKIAPGLGMDADNLEWGAALIVLFMILWASYKHSGA